ncbi:MAG: hypothetical protein WDM78_21020 [Puia sp.]
MIYSTGRPITLPLAVVRAGGASALYYSDRNQYRIPDYFRTDISVNMEGNHKANKKTHNFWSAGVYNVTGRQNAYSVYFVQENGKVKGYQLSILEPPHSICYVYYQILDNEGRAIEIFSDHSYYNGNNHVSQSI